MKSNYEYYLKIIKPIEKKYTRMCTLYHIFKLNTFRIKRNIYNRMIVDYYKFLLNNHNVLKEIEKKL